MMRFLSESEEMTADIAAHLAAHVKMGDVIALYGTLGAGKTVFCRGFIQALCPNQEVPSPTFTLLQTYETSRFPVYHFDMYRLKNSDEAYEIGIEDAFAEGVSLIEWPEKIESLLPQKLIRVHIVPQGTQRVITVEGIE